MPEARIRLVPKDRMQPTLLFAQVLDVSGRAKVDEEVVLLLTARGTLAGGLKAQILRTDSRGIAEFVWWPSKQADAGEGWLIATVEDRFAAVSLREWKPADPSP